MSLKIIQHRANTIDTVARTEYAEIDVQIDGNGRVVIGHDLWGETVDAKEYLECSPFTDYCTLLYLF